MHTHARITSASTDENMKGAERRLKGRVASIYTCPCCFMPSRWRSSRWTGIWWYTCWMSHLARRAPLLAWTTASAMASTETLLREHSAGSLTLCPSELERSSMRCHFSDWWHLGITPKLDAVSVVQEPSWPGTSSPSIQRQPLDTERMFRRHSCGLEPDWQSKPMWNPSAMP